MCISGSPDDTRAIGAAVATELRAGDVVILSGDLGAGKTCLVQGATQSLGVTEPVMSPSFVIVREYRGRVPVTHVDLYRLNTLQDLFELGYEDVFDSTRVAFIEWGDAVSQVLPEERLEVSLTLLSGGARRVAMRGVGTAWGNRMTSLSGALARWAEAS